MAIKFSELRGLLKDTKINTVKMSDPAYNIQLAQCTGNNWNSTFSKIMKINFFNLNKLKMTDRLDVVCLFCPSEINLWINTNNYYDIYKDGSDAYLFFRNYDLYNLNTALNTLVPHINRKPLLALFYVMNPVNGGALSEKEGVQKDFYGARIMNYSYYFGSMAKTPKDRAPFNHIPQVVGDSHYVELVIKVVPEIIKKNGSWNVLIGLGYKPDDSFTYDDICDISFWLHYGNAGIQNYMFDENDFTYGVHKNYRYNISNYFSGFDNRVVYE